MSSGRRAERHPGIAARAPARRAPDRMGAAPGSARRASPGSGTSPPSHVYRELGTLEAPQARAGRQAGATRPAPVHDHRRGPARVRVVARHRSAGTRAAALPAARRRCGSAVTSPRPRSPAFVDDDPRRARSPARVVRGSATPTIRTSRRSISFGRALRARGAGVARRALVLGGCRMRSQAQPGSSVAGAHRTGDGGPEGVAA